MQSDKALVESQIPSQTHTLISWGRGHVGFCDLIWNHWNWMCQQTEELCAGLSAQQGWQCEPSRHTTPGPGQRRQRVIHAHLGPLRSVNFGRKCMTEGFCSSGAGGWNMNHFCFPALFSSKPRKWNGLRAEETVAQAVSGRLMLASHRTMGHFLLTPVRLTLTRSVSGMSDLLSKSEQLVRHEWPQAELAPPQGFNLGCLGYWIWWFLKSARGAAEDAGVYLSQLHAEHWIL